ncbi:glycine cleavage system protein GcvH [Bdellovibrio bacteriovorus]|uniref:Glycine cleavage system protein H-like protein n=1 Tax=Bdellovibrio bacteriovorus str. Tiberius TaxID=1069642 RepID=K7ZB83_BDEBC|nr:glycine cleavage system protein GcvH [Bdellovibrio bacteriovorus]AFY02169.1 glycine cleavage system protein H-like protein [Bdellovibrio bacteriovorus str. Tiberius]
MPYFLPEELYYTTNHEWLHVDENLATIGLTEYALERLGEILYMELPEEGQHTTPGHTLSSIESVKNIHDLISTINGTVLEINASLIEDPTPLNDDPMSEGWLFRIEMDNERDLSSLIRSRDYKALISK